MNAQKFREFVMQALFGANAKMSSLEETLLLVQREVACSREEIQRIEKRTQEILDHQTAIDSLLQTASTSYAIERIQNVERNILRLGVYELLYDDDIPPKVAIAEAIRLSKKFSTPESLTFVNAILDKIHKEHCA